MSSTAQIVNDDDQLCLSVVPAILAKTAGLPGGFVNHDVEAALARERSLTL